jgi:hypothetical protein
MWLRIAFVALALFVVPQLGRTEEQRSAESPETLRAICDKAMPDLLQWKAPDALRKVAPDAAVDAIRSELRTKLESLRAQCGAPIDWIYAGIRKRGSMHCQFVYLCRHEQSVIVWRLTAIEVKGRWFLIGCHYDSDLAGILSQAPLPAPDNDSPYARLGDKIVDLLVHTRSEAVKTLKANAVQHDPASLESLRRGAEQVMAMVLVDGGVSKHGVVETRSVGGVLALRSYLVQCERGTIRLSFLFYRPGEDWKVFGCHFQPVSNADDLFAGAPLEAAAVAVPHTARTTKAEKNKDASPQPR